MTTTPATTPPAMGPALLLLLEVSEVDPAPVPVEPELDPVEVDVGFVTGDGVKALARSYQQAFFKSDSCHHALTKDTS